MGSAFPIFSIIFGEVLDVLTLPSDEVLASVHPWAAGFIGIGLATGTANFLKVGSGVATIGSCLGGNMEALISNVCKHCLISLCHTTNL